MRSNEGGLRQSWQELPSMLYKLQGPWTKLSSTCPPLLRLPLPTAEVACGGCCHNSERSGCRSWCCCSDLGCHPFVYLSHLLACCIVACNLATKRKFSHLCCHWQMVETDGEWGRVVLHSRASRICILISLAKLSNFSPDTVSVCVWLIAQI